MHDSVGTQFGLRRVGRLASGAGLCWLLALSAEAALNVPSDGSDGELFVATDTTIDLSQAVTGSWNANNGAHAGKGIYDPAKWAVVFKYSSVTVAAGATVRFVNHPSRAPVVWLVSGNATIAGTVNLNGGNWVAPPGLAEPGPGGFRGGTGYYTAGVGGSAGFGPGGGGTQTSSDQRQGSGGGYGTAGSGTVGYQGLAYGNPSLLPLLGGSGGGGDFDYDNAAAAGGGGGGAFLLACGDTLTLGGAVTASGGAGQRVSWAYSGGGSGGGIRLVANTLAGSGRIEALGGSGWAAGGLGRIRIERVVNEGNPQITPDPSVVALADGATPLIWPPADAPQVRIVSIGGEAIPADPRAAFGASMPDATIAETASTQVVVETTNVEEAAQVFVRAAPRSNANFTRVQATSHQVVNTNPLVIRWTVDLPVKVGYSAVQAHVVRP